MRLLSIMLRSYKLKKEVKFVETERVVYKILNNLILTNKLELKQSSQLLSNGHTTEYTYITKSTENEHYKSKICGTNFSYEPMMNFEENTYIDVVYIENNGGNNICTLY